MTEANAVLYTEHEVRNINIHIANEKYPTYGDSEFVRIAHLYVKMYVLISHTLDACGLHGMTVSIKQFKLIYSTTDEILVSPFLNSVSFFLCPKKDLVRFVGPLFHKNMTSFQQATVEEMEVFQSTIEPIWMFS